MPLTPHGGTIEVRSNAEETFTVSLPIEPTARIDS